MKQTNATRRLGQQLQEKLGYILLFFLGKAHAW